MGRLLGAAVVPSAPLLVPAVAPGIPAAHHDDIVGLREAAAAVIGRLPDADAVVLVAGGGRGIHVRAHVDLRGLGLPQVAREHPVATSLLPELTSRTQYAQRHGDDLDVDLAVLALQLPEGTPVVPVAVAPAEGASLAATGRALTGAIGRGDLDVTLLAAGDLSAALTEQSPRYHVEGAAQFDERAVRAFRDGDLTALTGLGEESRRVHARSWPSLVVGLAAARAAALSPRQVDYRTARGVGYVVGHLGP